MPKLGYTLDAWLDAATRGLREESQARIREEVEAHYLETLRSEIRKNEDALDAVLAADRSLGDARSARRQFRRRHLTKYESIFVGCFSEGTTGSRRSLVKRRDLSIQNLSGIFMLTISMFNTIPTLGEFAFIIVFIPLFILTTISIWNPPQRFNLVEKFQWRARIAAVQALLHAAAVLCIGNLAMFGREDDLTITLQFFSDYGYPLVFGLLTTYCVWNTWFNLKIARKVRGHHQTPEAT